RLLKLPKFIQKLVEEGTLSMGQARPLITIESESDARKIADKTIKDGLSVRAVETLVRTFKTPSMHYEPVRQSDNHILDVQKNLQRKLGTRVRISGSSINISYSSTADLNRILELIGYEETE
ncbi:MAG: chromosome partitioning protein ParB, partial [Erysipelotrichaceae bacterium]|nr:chromosome partitioning protein ParB [Erysipelotrichaceae bacterium]